MILGIYIINSYSILIKAYSQKAVILTFDDDWKNQYKYAKPILEKYGLRGSFYISPGCTDNPDSKHCNNSGTPNSVLNWTDIKSLQESGHDIQPHGMTHKNLSALSNASLEYEIGQSKKKLLDHGINSTVYGNAFATGSNNLTVVKTISKYYDMARASFATLAFLKCDFQSYDNIDSNNTFTITTSKTGQTDCRTYSDNGNLNLFNRYSIPVFVHYDFDQGYHHNSSMILPGFIKEIDSQTIYNNNGKINAIPILAYHNIDNVNEYINPNWFSSTTDVNLFDREMKYLHDNGIKSITINNLGYNRTSNYLYIK
jgi:peptidoglycan/xylan/chitin deacetylase (PgdA/CDA1 family)